MVEYINIKGVRYPVYLRYGHLAEIERQTGLPWQKLFRTFDFSWTSSMVHIAMQHGHKIEYDEDPPLTVDDLITFYKAHPGELASHIEVVAMNMVKNEGAEQQFNNIQNGN